MHFDWIEDGVLAASAYPASERDVRSLHAQGIRAIITLTERPLTSIAKISPALLDELSLKTLHVPIDDFGPPTNEQVAEVAAFIDAMRTVELPALLHCAAGQGRTGTLLHAYYLSKGWSLQETMEWVPTRRSLCEFKSFSSSQQDFLKTFAASGRTHYV
ncbi:MAG: dual specificity protein phosphatase family protein [Anaerolineae bacterium]|nr:dual specificity protein phosphatase family protein [Anaerolineae bacterium]